MRCTTLHVFLRMTQKMYPPTLYDLLSCINMQLKAEMSAPW